jgi:ribonuclease D
LLIQDRKTFEQTIDAIREAGSFGWDTEFIQDRTYWPRLCLVQVSTSDRVAAIDPFEVGDLSPLWDVVTDPEILVILHAGAQDLQIAYDASSRVAQNVFDTQIAASFAGYGDSISYAGLLAREMGVRLSKKETMTDWSRRPLTDAQLAYALDDVRHLLPVHDRLTHKLDELGRLAWIDEEHRAYGDDRTFQRDPRRAWERLSKRRSLDRKALAVLREVAAWREETAATQNVPRNRILSDDVLVEVARRAPGKPRQLAAIRNLHEGVQRRYGADIISAVERGLQVPDQERPEPARLRSEDPARARLVDLMDQLVQIRARETGVGRTVLATRLDLDRAAAIHYGENSGGDLPPILRGWREELVGRDLRRLLDGELRLGVDPVARVPRVLSGDAAG